MSLNHRALPPDLVAHSALTEPEKRGFWQINEELLSKSEYHDLLVLAEAVLAPRVPGFRVIYTKHHESAMTATRGLCAHMLREGQLDEEAREAGTAWLLRDRPPTALLAFYFRLRELNFQHTRKQPAPTE